MPAGSLHRGDSTAVLGRASNASGAAGASKKSSISSSFRAQLLALRSMIVSTEIQFIRCINPNETQLPLQFNTDLVEHQLHCLGVIDTVRIRRAGFSYYGIGVK